MIKKPTFFITNDDGIHAPGIKYLWQSVQKNAETFVVAPDSERSGMSMATSPRLPLTLQKLSWEGSSQIWSVNGTPTDCVKLGLGVLMKEKKPDLILSGINSGTNAGRCIFHSGTVGCVIEGALRGILGIAFSAESYREPLYEPFAPFIFPIASYFLQHPPLKGTFLNVTFPHTEQIKGIRLARQGQSYWQGNPLHRSSPGGPSFYSLSDEWKFLEEEQESDIALLQKGFVTIVPIHIRELTDFQYFKEEREAFNNCFKMNDLAPLS